MSVPNPLNQAVIAQALHDLRNGQLRRCLSMGFGQQDLDALKQPALVSVLANAKVSWCSVRINQEVLRRLIQQAVDVEQDIRIIDRMLRLGASTNMVTEFYGLTHREVALRREVIGLPKRRGRHPVLDESQETLLWRHWKREFTKRRIVLKDRLKILMLSLDLAEEMEIPVSVIWATVNNWIDEGLA